jgi:hypothetical protein
MALIGAAALGLAAGAARSQIMAGDWSLAPPLDNAVRAIVEFQHEIYIAGDYFFTTGSYITRWNGAAFNPLPQPLPGG